MRRISMLVLLAPLMLLGNNNDADGCADSGSKADARQRQAMTPIRKGREHWGRVHLLADASAPFEPRFVSQRPFWKSEHELKRVRRGWRFW
jgi:hypothetical protein